MSRKLALAISCLSDLDRRWILEKLSISQRKQIAPLLTEISELGLDRDKHIIHSVLQDLFGSEREVPDVVKISHIDKLPNLDQFWRSLFIHGLEADKAELVKKANGNTMGDILSFGVVPEKLLNSFYNAVAREESDGTN